jgi:predicted GNAT family N-acyltransferase
MDTPPAFIVRPTSWRNSHIALEAVRRSVFIEEQRVPEALEWDEDDATARHVLALSVLGEQIGTGRLLPDGHIGRIAVLQEWRNKGVGSAIVTALIELARQNGLAAIKLHAQTHALGFYARHGFSAVGDEFMEAGITHREMRLQLNPDGVSRSDCKENPLFS